MRFIVAQVVVLLNCNMLYAQRGGEQVKRASLAGAWEFTMEPYGERRSGRCVLEEDSERLTGRCSASLPIHFEGAVKGSEIEFKAKLISNNFTHSSFKGKMAGEVISGTLTYAINAQGVPWTARRPATRPESAPRLHKFTPERFYRTISAETPPVLRIFPGDSVITTSLDAGGRDEKGIRRAFGGNPLTGPFYIEGAQPGDTLVIRLNRVRLNSNSAISGWNVVPNALVPAHLQEIKREQEFDNIWKLDKAKGVAVLARPTERLKNFAVPLQPMVGGIGVAPPSGEGVNTRDSGNHGGNLDYNQLKEGATVYLPVFQPGALLFIGDGHAAQGDGELSGDALETCLEIEFTVDVIKERTIQTPRAENDEYVMAIGIAGSLQGALQQATSEMARWLMSDYKLSASEIGIVLGASMRYDVADLVGSQVSIVAKIHKTVLAQLQSATEERK
ncbi:MAG: acetamidase/formamidase family protein [Blastocatellia bacterium]